MISSTIAASLPQLPSALPRYGEAQGAAGRADDGLFGLIPPLRSETGGAGGGVDLFPAFRGDGGAAGRGFSGTSALLGDFTPPPVRVQLPAAGAGPQQPAVVAQEPVAAPSRWVSYWGGVKPAVGVGTCMLSRREGAVQQGDARKVGAAVHACRMGLMGKQADVGINRPVGAEVVAWAPKRGSWEGSCLSGGSWATGDA